MLMLFQSQIVTLVKGLDQLGVDLFEKDKFLSNFKKLYGRMNYLETVKK